MTIRASILVPAYNAAEFLRETLASAVAQRVDGDREIIVLDDGSTDSTFDVARTFEREVRVLRQPNAGASATRNRLTALSTGEFVQYLDADDVLPEGALDSRIAALQQAGADVAYSDWSRLEPDSCRGFTIGAAKRLELGDTSEQAALTMFRGTWAPPAAWTFRRDFLDQMPAWREDLPVIQDARFTLDAALSGARFVHAAGVGALYRTGRAESLSRRNFRDFLADCLRNAEDVSTTIAARGPVSEAWRAALLEAYNYVARSAFPLDHDLALRAWHQLRALNARPVPLWPRIAFALERLVGHGVAARMMRSLDRVRGA